MPKAFMARPHPAGMVMPRKLKPIPQEPISAPAKAPEIMHVESEDEKVAKIRARLDTCGDAARPEFPAWVMEGTSLFEGLCRPAVEKSSKYAEFIWLAGVQVMLNYTALRVRIHMQEVGLNLFVGFISPFGQFYKSSSAELAHEYFKAVGVLDDARAMSTADGKILVWQAGSPEGLGLDMDRKNCKNSILYNEELHHFVSKAGIEGSAFPSTMLTIYEAGLFANTVTSRKNIFSFPPHTYCIGWLFCTTNTMFDKLWPRIAGANSGLADRMFFLLSPEEPKEPTVYAKPNLTEGAIRTKKCLDVATERGVYDYDDAKTVSQNLRGMDPRSMQLVQKFALYFAIDLGLGSITNDCVQRALALVEYRNQAKAYLNPVEAEGQEARVQGEIRRTLRRNAGVMTTRDLRRKMEFERFGTTDWNRAYEGLKKFDEIIEWTEKTFSGQSKKFVGLLKQED